VIIQSLDVLDFSVIHLSAYERSSHKHRCVSVLRVFIVFNFLIVYSYRISTTLVSLKTGNSCCFFLLNGTLRLFVHCPLYAEINCGRIEKTWFENGITSTLSSTQVSLSNQHLYWWNVLAFSTIFNYCRKVFSSIGTPGLYWNVDNFITCVALHCFTIFLFSFYP